jgi:hypothetical protein
MLPGAPVGPAGGKVGNLMVGAADGLGGKVMRTVSFFGWTLPVDFFIGVTGAPGTPGGGGVCGLSAICFQIKINPPYGLSNQIPKLFAPRTRLGSGTVFDAGVAGLIWVDLGLAHKNKQSFFSWKSLGWAWLGLARLGTP